MTVRAPAAADGDDHDLAGEARIGQRHRLAIDVREGELERFRAWCERGFRGVAGECRRRIAHSLEALVSPAAAAELATQAAAVVEPGDIQERAATVEARQHQHVAANLAGEIPVVATGAQHRAGHFAAPLFELRHGSALHPAVGAGEGQRPAAGKVLGLFAARRKEPPGLVALGDEAHLGDPAARAHEGDVADEPAVLERRSESMRIGRHLHLDARAIDAHLVDANALGAIDEPGDVVVTLPADLEAEGQVAARHRQHGAPGAVDVRGRLAGRERQEASECSMAPATRP